MKTFFIYNFKRSLKHKPILIIQYFKIVSQHAKGASYKIISYRWVEFEVCEVINFSFIL